MGRAAVMAGPRMGGFMPGMGPDMRRPGGGAPRMTDHPTGGIPRTMVGDEHPGIGDAGVPDEAGDTRSVTRTREIMAQKPGHLEVRQVMPGSQGGGGERGELAAKAPGIKKVMVAAEAEPVVKALGAGEVLGVSEIGVVVMPPGVINAIGGTETEMGVMASGAVEVPGEAEIEPLITVPKVAGVPPESDLAAIMAPAVEGIAPEVEPSIMRPVVEKVPVKREVPMPGEVAVRPILVTGRIFGIFRVPRKAEEAGAEEGDLVLRREVRGGIRRRVGRLKEVGG
jgi:hypothetical protein